MKLFCIRIVQKTRLNFLIKFSNILALQRWKWNLIEQSYCLDKQLCSYRASPAILYIWEFPFENFSNSFQHPHAELLATFWLRICGVFWRNLRLNDFIKLLITREQYDRSNQLSISYLSWHITHIMIISLRNLISR